MNTDLEVARAVADAVLYEGYLLYPYRSTSSKNQLRWQFGVLGPPDAAAAGFGEEPDLQTQCLLRAGPSASIQIHLRFLHLQHRGIEKRCADDSFTAIERLDVGGTTWIGWDEAVACDVELGPFELGPDQTLDRLLDVDVDANEQIELLPDSSGEIAGRVIRRREALTAQVAISIEPDGEWVRLTVRIGNTGAGASSAQDALSRSLIGAHLLLDAQDASFLSMTDPPPGAEAAANRSAQHRCWPVLTGLPGCDHLLLVSPIILYDYPELAAQSPGDLFDATEIDEILTLRVLTMTDEEKAQARATDPRAAAIIDRCEQLAPADMQRLHGVLRDPRAGTSMLTGDDWWAAEAAAEVTPELDTVWVAGMELGKDSRVRLRPSRRADAQDIFYAGQEARISAVHVDLDGTTHVAVTLIDDPAAEFHDWYGRYLYFAPEELEPLADQQLADHHQREESS